MCGGEFVDVSMRANAAMCGIDGGRRVVRGYLPRKVSAMARLLSVNVGLPRDVDWHGKIVRTAVWKSPVDGPRMVRRLNIDGDGQGDRAGHGGEQRAVFVYQIESYRFWQDELERRDFDYGQFGENFTVEGLPDKDVCIGDRYRIGHVLLEVTQPRVTCYRVGIRMNEPRMAALLVMHDRPGFYCRVIEEGEVQAGDDIVQVSAARERMTVSEVNALLYKPGHARSDLERALRIPALSPGWRGSFQALLDRPAGASQQVGNPGLEADRGPRPAWEGFRPMRVVRKDRESATVTSVTLAPVDGPPVAQALAGQFLLMRLRPEADAPALLRTYSLSGGPSDASYRVSVKRQTPAGAGTYVQSRLQVGDVVDVGAPRGRFTLAPGDGPVVLLSAGVGATPVLAMLHALAAANSTRDVWWIYGARDGSEHPFKQEVRTLLAGLSRGHGYVRYSSPRAVDRPGTDYDAVGRLDAGVIDELGVPRDADFYLCGPPAFMSDLIAGLGRLGVTAGHLRSEVFGPGASITPGIAALTARAAHIPQGPEGDGPLVSFARSNIAVRWSSTYASLLELAEACDVPVRWSCRTGVCHSCVTGLIDGQIGYDPAPVDLPDPASTLICCSQPKSDVSLDL
jgi:MOSC domain-containing protein YiiM/ferredoxin-NADP reductase/ferredoxin